MASSHKSSSSESLASEDMSHHTPIKRMPPKNKGVLPYNATSSKPSACVIYRKQSVYNPVPSRVSIAGPPGSEVRQRVQSARRLRIKTQQNQLTEARQELEKLQHENRMLKTLHQRQGLALAKYESSNSELPQLLKSHSEELRMWQTKFKNMHLAKKDLEQRLQQRETLVTSLSDQNKFFNQLNKDKNLKERQLLTEENEALKAQLREKEAELKNLQKKNELEVKNLKFQLQNEQRKARNAQIETEKCRLEVNAFSKLDQMNIPNNAAQGRRTKLVKKDSKLETRALNKVETKGMTKLDSLLEKALESENKKFDPIAKKNVRGTNALGRTDRGDGDAAVSNLLKNTAKNVKPLTKKGPLLSKSKLQTNQPSTQTSALAVRKEKIIAKKHDKTEEQKEAEMKEQEEYKEITPMTELVEVKEHSAGSEYFDVNKYISKMDDGEDNESISKDDHNDTDNFSETEFNTTRMRADIAHIRNKILGDDYERREEFIDGFCLQNSLNNNDFDDTDENENENEEKYRNFTKDNLQGCPVMKNV